MNVNHQNELKMVTKTTGIHSGNPNPLCHQFRYGQDKKNFSRFLSFFLVKQKLSGKITIWWWKIKMGFFFRRLKQKPKIYLSIFEHRKGDQKQRTKIKSINNRYKDLLDLNDLHITYFWCLFRFQKKERYLIRSHTNHTI